MNIADVVVYEKVHELRVTYPNSDRYLGLTIGVRNASSEASKAAMRKMENDRQTKSRNKQKKITAEVLEENELFLTASTMAWWKWEMSEPSDASKAAMAKARLDGKSEAEAEALNDATMANYQGDQPDLSLAIGAEVLDKVSFIYAQVKGASTDVENFMKGDVNGSKSSSAS